MTRYTGRRKNAHTFYTGLDVRELSMCVYGGNERSGSGARRKRNEGAPPFELGTMLFMPDRASTRGHRRFVHLLFSERARNKNAGKAFRCPGDA